MAGSILTAPSTTLSTNTEWQNELGYTEAARYGYDGVSLTEWASGNTNKPQIAAGSTIEIDGAMAEYASNTALTDDGSLADGWCYIKHVVSGAVVTPTLTNTWGTWDTAKQGYYDGSGNRYSLFAMYRSGAVTKIFTEKANIPHSEAIFGYRYYDKTYTGTTSGSPFYAISFTDTFFHLTEFHGLLSSYIEISSGIWNDGVASIVAGRQISESGGFNFAQTNSSSSYGSKPYITVIKYKLTL